MFIMEELVKIIEKISIPFAYEHFAEGVLYKRIIYDEIGKNKYKIKSILCQNNNIVAC